MNTKRTNKQCNDPQCDSSDKCDNNTENVEGFMRKTCPNRYNKGCTPNVYNYGHQKYKRTVVQCPKKYKNNMTYANCLIDHYGIPKCPSGIKIISKHPCSYCGSVIGAHITCDKCKSMFYCSERCRIENWNHTHHNTCTMQSKIYKGTITKKEATILIKKMTYEKNFKEHHVRIMNNIREHYTDITDECDDEEYDETIGDGIENESFEQAHKFEELNDHDIVPEEMYELESFFYDDNEEDEGEQNHISSDVNVDSKWMRRRHGDRNRAMPMVYGRRKWRKRRPKSRPGMKLMFHPVYGWRYTRWMHPLDRLLYSMYDNNRDYRYDPYY